MNKYNKAYLQENFFGKKADSLLINHYKKIKTGAKILDIGIGQGRNAFFLLDKGFSVHGIEPSKVAIDKLTKQINQEVINLEVFHTGFSEFKHKPNSYDAILIFGLIQILSEEQIEILAEKTFKWLKKDGLIFLTGFTRREKVFMPKTDKWEKISKSSFTDNNGNYRTFLSLDDAISYFNNFKTLYKWEGLGKKHVHGTEPEEQHHLFELILGFNK